jgi:tetratricopeptide (TPR) repeat protein
MRNDMRIDKLEYDARLLSANGEHAGAVDKYVEALELQKKLFGLEQERAGKLLESAVQALINLGRVDDANELLTRYYISPQKGRHSADWLGWRATVLARRGRWREASQNAAMAVEIRPDNVGLKHTLAPLLVAANRVEDYRQLCRQMVARFAGTTDASTADVIAKDCLILPSSEADLDAVAALAETAVTRGKGEGPYTFYLCTKALADYRQGKFQDAATQTVEILKDPFPYTQAEGSAVLAMAQFRLGQPKEARDALLRLETVVSQQLPAPGSRDLGHDWKDWIISHALLDEVMGLIEGAGSTNSDWRATPHE